MRAGAYAVVDGVTYSCGRQDVSPIRLLVPGSEPQPEGFERDKRGRWTRRVDRSDVSRLFFVRTTATWRDHTVDVRDVFGDSAQVEYRGTDLNGEPELTLTDYSVWSGSVPVSSLGNVVEEELEFQG